MIERVKILRENNQSKSETNVLSKPGTSGSGYFKRLRAELEKDSSETGETESFSSAANQNDGNENSAENAVEPPDVEKCDQCGENVSPFDMPEHLDFHVAQDLQRDMNTAARSEPMTVRTVTMPTKAIKRKGREGKARCDKNVGQKKIKSFFTAS